MEKLSQAETYKRRATYLFFQAGIQLEMAEEWDLFQLDRDILREQAAEDIYLAGVFLSHLMQ